MDTGEREVASLLAMIRLAVPVRICSPGTQCRARDVADLPGEWEVTGRDTMVAC